MSLSPAATIVLVRAAERPDHRLEFHRKLPTGGRHKMIDALLREGLIAETQGDYRLGDGALLIEDSATGLMLTTLALTDTGFRALNLDPLGSEPAAETDSTAAPTAPDAASVQVEALAVADAMEAARAAPAAAPRANLRDAAAAVLAAWMDETNRETDIIAALEAPMDALHTALAAKPGRPDREPGTTRKPRAGTKQEAVLTMLRRAEGATVAQIAEATGWASHTVRGFLAGLKKKGIKVATLDRVRMVGPNKEGAKGSYTIYQIAE
jgi:DNA-binding IclR family transcriptional regulator